MRKLALIVTLSALGSVLPGFSAPIDQDTYFTPYQAEDAYNRYLGLINAENSKIRMAAYGFTDAGITNALLAAKKRGVDIQIVMDGTEAAGAHQRPFVIQLEQAGVSVLIGKSPVHNQLLHAKFTVFHDLVVEDGSWNYSPSADQQFNTLNFTTDTARAAAFTAAWQKIHDYLETRHKTSLIFFVDPESPTPQAIQFKFKTPGEIPTLER